MTSKFSLAIHRIVPIAIALLLLAAAALKTIQLPVLFVKPLHGWEDQAWFVAALVQCELFLGFWLLSGQWQAAARWVAIGCFVLFAGVSIHHALAGRASCGCFGKLTVPPWLTAGIDLAAVAGLLLTQPKWESNSRRRLVGLVASIAIVSAGLWGWVGLHPVHAIENNLSLAGTDAGGIVILEPEHWPGKPFPMTQEIADDKPLLRGDWIVILFHHDCSTCRETIPKYIEAARSASSSPSFRLALVEIPPRTTDDLIDLSGLPATGLNLSLKPDHQWFAQTPVVVRLKDGIVAATREGEAAADPLAMIGSAGKDIVSLK